MKFLNDIKDKLEARKAQRKENTTAKAIAAKELREASLPVIRLVAKEYDAKVDVLDTAAYVHKNTGPGGREELGTHINYGLSADEIRVKLDKAFTKSALASKITKGVKKFAHDVKKTKKELGEIRKELKGVLGDGPSLYPPIDWGRGKK